MYPYLFPGEQDFIAKNRALMGKFYFNYAMLIVNSFGLQNALERSAVDIGHFFARCHSSASSCATLIRDELAPLGYLRYAPDSNFVMGSYAVLSLMKVSVQNLRVRRNMLIQGSQLLRPEFQTFLDHEQKTITLVKDVADAFESVAVSASHTPGLYSAFLRALLAARTDTTNPSSEQGKAYSVSETRRSTPAPESQHQRTRPPNSGASSNSNGSMAPPSIIPGGVAHNGEIVPDEFQFASEMGPVADITTFPPIMAPQQQDPMGGMMPMDTILSTEFWDNVLVPGTSCSFNYFLPSWSLNFCL